MRKDGCIHVVDNLKVLLYPQQAVATTEAIFTLKEH
jgi:hypothetical protein